MAFFGKMRFALAILALILTFSGSHSLTIDNVYVVEQVGDSEDNLATEGILCVYCNYVISY